MKNLIRARGVPSLPALEKIPCRASNGKAMKILSRRYGEASHHQRDSRRAQIRFYNKLHGKAMDAAYAEARAEKGGRWRELFTAPDKDCVETFNEINTAFFPHLSGRIKKHMPGDAYLIRCKLLEVSRRLIDEGYGGTAARAHSALMAMSVRIKRWLLEGKVEIYFREIEGKKILGFDFPNPDGSKGGFVAATCHFHCAGQIVVDRSSMVLGTTSFVGDVSVKYGSVVDGHNRLQSSFLFSSNVSNSALRGSYLVRANCYGCHLDGVNAKYLDIKDSLAVRSSFNTCTLEKCSARDTTATILMASLANFRACSLTKVNCRQSSIEDAIARRSTIRSSMVSGCSLGPGVDVSHSRISGRVEAFRRIAHAVDGMPR